MLQKFNERIQGVVAWTIIGIVALTFTLFGIDSYIQAHHQASSIEAEVDGKSISKQAVELQYRRIRQAQEASGVTDGGEKALRHSILDDMIANEVNVQAARHYGFGLDEAIATSAILQIPQFQENGQFSQDRFQQALSNAMFTPHTFQQEVQQGMLLNQQRFAFMGTAFALPGEVERFIKLYGQTRDYRYVLIPSKVFSKRAEVSLDEIKAYYSQHQKEFLSPEMVQLEVIKLSQSAVRDSFKPSEKELIAFYEENQANYMAPARWSVQHVLFETSANASKAEQEKVKARADAFYEVVKDKPGLFDTTSKAVAIEYPGHVKTGTLPWVIAGESELDELLVNLTHAKDIMAPIKTENGYEVFQLLAYEPAHLKPFKAVQEEVAAHWISDKAQLEYTRLQEILSEQSYQTPDALEPVAEVLSLPIEYTEFFSREGGQDALTQSAEVIRAAFSHDVLALGNNSSPIQLDDDTMVVVRVKAHREAEEMPLKAVSQVIQAKLRQEKAQKLATQLGEQLLEANPSHPIDDTVFVANRLSWKDVTKATRESSLAPLAVNQQAFKLSDTNQRAGVALPNNEGFAVVELQKITDGDFNMLDSEQVASISQQMGSNYGAIDYDLYVNALLEKAKIKRND